MYIKWLYERELLKHPVTLKALRVVKKRVQFYSTEQIQTMLNYCREILSRRYHLSYRCIRIFSQTGMRGGELLNLRWSEVEEKRIKIVSTDSWQLKNRRDAWVPVSPKLQQEWNQWDKTEEIWVLDKGNGAPPPRNIRHIHILDPVGKALQPFRKPDNLTLARM